MKLKFHLHILTATTLMLLMAISCLPAFAQLHQPSNMHQGGMKGAQLLFIENKGQVRDDKNNLRSDILFTANSGNVNIYLTTNSISYQLSKTDFPESYQPGADERYNSAQQKAALQKQTLYSTHCFTVQLQAANPQPHVRREQQSAYTENFYLAGCPNGITGVHGYQKITYEDVYPGIDWVVYTKEGFIKYDFLVHPGADPSLIRLEVNDADGVSLSGAGDLKIHTSLGDITEIAPVSFTADRKKIVTQFVLQGNTFSFALKNDWDKQQLLTIDPSITWATYYGGPGDETSYGCVTDGSGYVYLAGSTNSTSGIASGGFQNTYGGSQADAIVVKFDTSGNRLWATYYGGSNNDQGLACVTDASGNIYVTGYTESVNGIASGGFQNTYSSYYDAFLVKFSSAGTRLWATYYGGAGVDITNACVTDGSGNVYIAGSTDSPSMASGGFQNTYGGGDNDVLLVKFDASGNRVWATYYGGSRTDEGYGCAIDGSGNIYITGTTNSVTGIAAGGFQSTFGGGDIDAFLVKLDASGNRLWGTYYGSNNFDFGYNCTTDGSGNVYLAGYTSSTSGIAINGFQNTFSGYEDMFLVKFNSLGARLWGTYYGGSNEDETRVCVADGSGNIYLAGYTRSTSGVAAGGFQNTNGGVTDGLLIKFDASGMRLWATYYGGSGYDVIRSCALAVNGRLYLAGSTTSGSGIASGGFQNVLSGTSDCFLAKIDGSGGALPVTLSGIKAYQQQNNIVVEWYVLNETNTSFYEIEKSLNGNTFSNTGKVVAIGSNSYQWPDIHVVAGNNFYRIRCVDRDGSSKYSQVVNVIVGENKGSYQVFPNPISHNGFTLSFINQPMGRYQVQLLNTTGQVVYNQIINHNNGSSAETIVPAGRLQKGNYLLRITDPNDKQQVIKITY